MPALNCEHCASTRVQPFTPERVAQTVGTILLCLACQRLTISCTTRHEARSATRRFRPAA
jgi:hypothetical protein